MLIVCPNCATSYRVVAENLGDTGRSVRCVSCHHVWFEEPHQTDPEAEAFSSEPGEPENAARSPIRPPLNDVVDIGSSLYSQTDSGEGKVPGSDHHEDFAGGQHGMGAGGSDLDGAPLSRNGDRPSSDIDAEQTVERAAARRSFRRPKPPSRLLTASAAIPALIGVLVLTLASIVTLRQQIVRHLPQTASLYAMLGMPVNLRGLQFGNIKTVREMQDGVPVLVVEGEIVGTSARLTEIPRLRFAVVDRNGKEIYAWTARPDRTLLPPGEALPFRSRLASPPAEASGVNVRFFNRHDAQAGFM
jgi:predicted Zn finger-like uncharacterized protein